MALVWSTSYYKPPVFCCPLIRSSSRSGCTTYKVKEKSNLRSRFCTKREIREPISEETVNPGKNKKLKGIANQPFIYLLQLHTTSIAAVVVVAEVLCEAEKPFLALILSLSLSICLSSFFHFFLSLPPHHSLRHARSAVQQLKVPSGDTTVSLLILLPLSLPWNSLSVSPLYNVSFLNLFTKNVWRILTCSARRQNCWTGFSLFFFIPSPVCIVHWFSSSKYG